MRALRRNDGNDNDKDNVDGADDSDGFSDPAPAWGVENRMDAKDHQGSESGIFFDALETEAPSSELALEVYPYDNGSGEAPDNIDLAERVKLLEEEHKLLKARQDIKDAPRDHSSTHQPGSRRGTVLIRTSFDIGNSERSTFTCDAIELPESTYALIITVSSFFSPACILAAATAVLSMACLLLALIYSFQHGTTNNPLGLPVGVSPLVRGAQYLGVLIGVLMEDEIPQGLELLAISSRGSFILNDSAAIHHRVLVSSILRLIIGYMFLMALFITVMQTNDVLEVFFDVLALQFVESIDDVAYNLGKRGFFGLSIMNDTKRKHKLQTVQNEQGISSKSWAHRVARTVYYLNAVVLLVGVFVIGTQQHEGLYRCKALTVEFDEKIWEDAIVTLKDDDFYEQWHLVYPYFNGVYEEDGLYDGYPKYVERNKNDGNEFQRTIGAEFIYCKRINAWVFRHINIQTSQNEEHENECSWLARSQETLEYDLMAVATEEWFVWTGKKESIYIHVLCNECSGYWDCNYRGKCNDDKRCVCSEDTYFGDHCQFESPCTVLESKVGYGCGELSLQGDETGFDKLYGRPIYKRENLSGTPLNSSSPENTVAFLLGKDINPVTELWFQNHTASLLSNYTVFLIFSGSRWYGSMLPPETIIKFEDSKFLSEYHAFWEHSYKKDNTFLISEVTFEGCPVITEFSLGSRQVEHVDLDGSGLFYCWSKSSCEAKGTNNSFE